MNRFNYRDGELYCEQWRVQQVAEKYGTPLYLYSKNMIIDNFQATDRAFADVPHLICYAMKANSNFQILKLLAQLGSGADVVSGGELAMALKAGVPASKIVYAGVGKTDAEMQLGIESGILAFNVESEAELQVINDIAKRMGRRAPVALRINPDIDIHGHPYISTGKAINKFGIEIERGLAVFQKAQQMAGIAIVGVHCHIGSQILNLEYYVASAKKLFDFVGELRASGIDIQHVDIGGGLGVHYPDMVPDFAEAKTAESVPTPAELANQVLEVLKPLKCQVLFEPGRSIIGETAALITKVLFVKKSRDKHFVVVDAGMNDLIRPSLYNAYHQIVPLQQRSGPKTLVDVVGPICETGDFLAKDRLLPPLQRGDYLAVMTAGAYGYSLASNYNSRPRPAEVWIDGDHDEVIRAREILV
ncbi:MAG: diaminopimelate decarboxylase [candidate division KSB1 bacterium]|nr:diaminopimelate decarboxylase [candidate division KSB1 bacterium]MDZ7339858.1 diaminopimelate decarboxylase [candidate division KSB1 bacterium]